MRGAIFVSLSFLHPPGRPGILEVLAEMGSQFFCPPVVFAYIVPGIGGIKKVIRHPRAEGRHFSLNTGWVT